MDMVAEAVDQMDAAGLRRSAGTLLRRHPRPENWIVRFVARYLRSAADEIEQGRYPL